MYHIVLYSIWSYENEWFESSWKNYFTSITSKCHVIKATIYCFLWRTKKTPKIKRNQENRSWSKKKYCLVPVLSVNLMMVLIGLQWSGNFKWCRRYEAIIDKIKLLTTEKQKEDELQEIRHRLKEFNKKKELLLKWHCLYLFCVLSKKGFLFFLWYFNIIHLDLLLLFLNGGSLHQISALD